MEKNMTILVLKLTSGEDVLGEASVYQAQWRIKNPVGIAVVRGKDGQPNVGLSPFPLHAPQKKDATIDIPLASVVYSYEPAQEFIDNYNQIFGSGIVLPTPKQIITG
jgi:hypothetical protein